MNPFTTLICLFLFFGCHKNNPIPSNDTLDTIPRMVIDTLRFEKGQKIRDNDSVLSSYIVWHMHYHFTNKPGMTDWHQLNSVPEIFKYSGTWDYIEPFKPDTTIYFIDTVFSRTTLAQNGTLYKLKIDVHYWYFDQIKYPGRQALGQSNVVDSVVIKW